jgi:hypothetical protein
VPTLEKLAGGVSDFANAGALVSGKLNDLVVAGGMRRENLGDPVGSTPHTARIDLLQVANNENVRLHECSIAGSSC